MTDTEAITYADTTEVWQQWYTAAILNTIGASVFLGVQGNPYDNSRNLFKYIGITAPA